MRNHVHPLTIFANLWRVFYFTIIPVVRGFTLAVQGDFSSWLQGAWIDILIFVLMLSLAVWRWWVVTYTFDDHELVLNTGWLFTKQIRVDWSRIATVSLVESYYLRPFHAARLRADTLGGSAGKADFSLILGINQARALLERQRSQWQHSPARQYIPRTRSILSLALLTSNSFAGILFIATFVSQTGKLLGNEFSDMLIGTFEEAARLLAFGIPPAAAAIAYILLFGWLIGFYVTFVRYKNFAVYRSGATLNIGGGIFTNREYCVHFGDVHFIDIRQSLVTKVLHLYSLYISAVGYGKREDDISCIIPTENRKIFTLHRERLFPAFSPSPRQIAPKLTGIMRFIAIPLEICGGIPLATFLLIYFFPSWRDFVLFVGLMSMVPALFFLVIRIAEFSFGGVAKSGKYYTMRYSKGFSLHTVIFHEDKVVSIELDQGPFQRLSPNCDLLIHTRAETHAVHRCRQLNKEQLAALLQIHP